VSLQLLPDVVFDHAAARRAAEECRAAAEQVATVLDRRSQGLTHARAGWEGAARDDADRVAGILADEGRDLHRRLRSTAVQIERAMQDAAAEQRRRDAENEGRREEHRRAQLAEQQRREGAARQAGTGGSSRTAGPR